MHIFVASLLVVLLPILFGLAVSRCLLNTSAFNSSDKVLSIPIVFSIGLGGLGLLSSFFYVTGGSLLVFLATSSAIFIVLFIVSKKYVQPTNRSKKTTAGIFFVFGVALALFIAQYPIGTYQNPSSDTFRHLAFINKIASNNSFTHANFLLSKHVPISALTAAYSFNFIHVLYAAVSKIVSVPYSIIFIFTGSFLIPIIFLGVSSISIKLKSGGVGVCLAAILTLLWWANSVFNTAVLSFPSTFGFTVYLALTGWILGDVMGGKKTSLLITSIQAILLASLITIHLQWWFYGLFTVFGLFLCSLVIHNNSKTIFKYFLTLTLISSAISLALLYQKYQFQGAYSVEFGELLRYRFESKLFTIGNLFAFNPLENISGRIQFYCCLSLIYTVTYILKPSVREKHILVPSLLILFISAIMFNPLVVPVLVKYVSFTLVHRMNYLIDLWGIILCGTLFGQIFERKIQHRFRWRPTRFLAFCGGGVVCLPFILLPSSAISITRTSGQITKYASLYGPNITQIDSSPKLLNLLSKIPSKSTVLTDNPNVLLAFSDVLIPGEIHRLSTLAKQIEVKTDQILGVDADLKVDLSSLSDLEIEYVFLTPSHSDLSWMKFNNSNLLEIVEELHLPEFGFHNNLFILYKVKTADVAAPSNLNEPVDAEHDYEQVTLYPSKINTSVSPNEGLVCLERLFDKKYKTREDALTWNLPRYNWFSIEFDFEKEVYLDEITITLNHFDSRYKSDLFAIYTSQDGVNYSHVETLMLDGLPFRGIQKIHFGALHCSGRYVRLAVRNQKYATIAEILFLGHK